MNEKININFEGKAIRRKLVGDKWFFSVVDVVGVLSESENPRDYWYKLKVREQESSGIELSTFCRQLKIIAEDGKLRETDCADIEGIFRIIQSIPSKKAEPFKRWLAKVGYVRNVLFSISEHVKNSKFLSTLWNSNSRSPKNPTDKQKGFFDERIQEIENPELAQERMKQLLIEVRN